MCRRKFADCEAVGVGREDRMGDSPSCTCMRKIRPQFLRCMHILLNPRLKLCANIPWLHYCPQPSDQLSWPTLTGNVIVVLPCPPIVKILKLFALLPFG